MVFYFEKSISVCIWCVIFENRPNLLCGFVCKKLTQPGTELDPRHVFDGAAARVVNETRQKHNACGTTLTD